MKGATLPLSTQQFTPLSHGIHSNSIQTTNKTIDQWEKVYENRIQTLSLRKETSNDYIISSIRKEESFSILSDK